jgi:hypothetical protein
MTVRQNLLCVALILGVAVPGAMAKTSNGNDFALYYIEARSDQERNELVADAKGRPHFFRYLQIMQMEKGEKDGRPFIAILAFEPASFMDVKFFVSKRVSLRKLSEEPISTLGDAIAVTGVIKSVADNTITLSPMVVRHKDRLSPKRGKELLCEVDPGATFYSYTGGNKAVSLTYKDRDLLQHRDQIIAKEGKQGWTDFLTRELAKRDKVRAAAAKAYRARQP